VKTVLEIVADCAGLEGPLLPVLHSVQKQDGCVSETAIRDIASALNLTRAEVHGVASFYQDFKQAPEARPVLKLCRAEACQARGVAALLPIADRQSRVHVEPIYCLGLCAVGPAAMVGDKVHARLDEARFAAVLATV
jgi:formate dehydrogenase subunit gamma